jgi:hypothetical protein
MKEVLFVNFQRPGQIRNVNETNEIRRHVRKVVLRERGFSDIGKRIKQFTMVRSFKSACYITLTKGRKESKNISNSKRHKKDELDEPSSCGHAENIIHSSNTDSNYGYHQSCLCTIGNQVSLRHPYTSYVAVFVQLPIDRIDSLLKSRTS